MKLLPVIAAALLATSITAQAAEPVDARQVAQSLANSFMAAYDTRDPKAVSALFLPDAVFMGFALDAPVSHGREAIERAYAGAMKNMGGHFTIVIKDAVPVGGDVIVANDELEIRDAGQNHDIIHGRAVITLAKTPEGWRFVAIAGQKLP